MTRIFADCVSSTVMAEEGIAKALTGDHHFEQAGFLPTGPLRDRENSSEMPHVV
jgi:hypothetical protein